MLKCWAKLPAQRPTFSELVNTLSSSLSSKAGYLDVSTALNEHRCSIFTPRPERRVSALAERRVSVLPERRVSVLPERRVSTLPDPDLQERRISPLCAANPESAEKVSHTSSVESQWVTINRHQSLQNIYIRK